MHQYMSPNPSFGRFDSPRSSVQTLDSPSSAANPFRDSALSLAASSVRAKYGLLDDTTFYSNDVFAREDDDPLHDPGPAAPRFGKSHYISETSGFRRGSGLTFLGFLNVLTVLALMLGLIFVFAGLPITHWAQETFGRYNTSVPFYDDGAAFIGAPYISNRWIIDPDTPKAAYTKSSVDGTSKMQLVFSDEFETEGRLFYDSLDPWWTAQDFHYWQTEDLEWYDPDNVYTEGGNLVLKLTKESNASSHGLGYLGGMVQSWNKFCWTGGQIEVKLSLPGDLKASGLWPAVWMMGNLGHVGYGASLEGMWPYMYDECDVGTLPNQTDPKTGLPTFTAAEGDQYHYNDFNYLTGQRLSRCTCPGDDHPGPKHKDTGEYVGRSAPEIDVFEALITEGHGNISQSAQMAPFNAGYELTHNSSADYVEYFDNDYLTSPNSYKGGVYQQVISGLSETNPDSYNTSNPDEMATYGVEYRPTAWDGYGTGEIYWLQQGDAMWRFSDKAVAASARENISNRTVTNEPLYIIANLGMSPSFQWVDFENLVFPAYMHIDYIRVYQDPDHINIGCSPEDMPTAEYIERHKPAYINSNYTTWDDYLADYPNVTTPRNRLVDDC
ncbi:hypothetical protein JCM11251_000020 [Rhodosporidiobolus azoricus]